MLVASYATNGLEVVVRVADFALPTDAEEPRDTFLVGEAVVVRRARRIGEARATCLSPG